MTSNSVTQVDSPEIAAAKRTGLWHRAERVAVIETTADRMLKAVLAEPDAPVVAPPLSIGDARLLKLADFLDTLPPEKFHLRSFVQEHSGSCGTVCCAIGWCPAVFPESWAWRDFGKGIDPRLIGSPALEPWTDARTFFGLLGVEDMHLFSSEEYHTNASPVMVADRIREFVSARTQKAQVSQ